jgi:hypothetical protein
MRFVKEPFNGRNGNDYTLLVGQTDAGDETRNTGVIPGVHHALCLIASHRPLRFSLVSAVHKKEQTMNTLIDRKLTIPSAKVSGLRRRFPLTILALVFLLAQTLARAGQPITPLAVTDQLPPGIGPNTGFLLFGYGSVLNDAGQVVFNASLMGVGIDSTNDVGLFSGAPGTLELVARKGSLAPGPDGKIYLGPFSPLGLSPSSNIVFQDYRGYDLGSSSLALYTGLPGAIELLAENGDIIPGAPGPILELDAGGSSVANSTVPINNANHTVFGATFEGDTYRSLVVGAPGSLSIAAEPGMQAPGLPNGVTFSFLNNSTLSLNSEDRLAFEAQLFDSSTQTYSESLFSGLPNSLALLARTGDQAAGTDPGVFYEIFSGSVPRLSESGVVAFGAYLTGNGVQQSNSNALWVGVPGALELVARGDMQAPGVEPGVTYGITPGLGFSLAFYAITNSSGEIAFAQYLSTGEQAIWAGPPDNLRLVARQGQSAPGLAPGEKFSPGGVSGNGLTFVDLYINDAGSVAFRAVIGTHDPNFDTAIYVGNPDGELVYVTRYGDPVTLDDGQTLSFSSMVLDGFNSKGQTLIHSSLSDGSDGLFLADAAVPVVTSALVNISTRMQVLTDDKLLIGGFIITGNAPKKVILRAIGPSLTAFGLTDALVDPVLELHMPDMTVVTNDNWKETQQAEIEAAGFAPGSEEESAIIATLAPGSYTAIVSGKNGGMGIGLVEAYDLDAAADSTLANISTRGFVDTGDNVMIGGVIIGGGTSQVLVRAIGPELTPLGVNGALEDTTLELHDKDGVQIVSNDDWKETQQADIEATGLAPADDRESAILATLAPDSYTAIVRGKDDTTGVGLVEVYNVSP